MLVVVHHASQAYGPFNAVWPVRALMGVWPELGALQAVNASFFMGLFFVISGYLTEGSYERKGARRFLRDRFVRFGVPTVAMVFAVHLPARWIMSGSPPFWGYLLKVFLRDALTMVGHLWFLVHLLVYALAYVAYRQGCAPRGAATSLRRPPPGHRAIALYVLGLSVVGGLVRIGYPINHWVTVAWIVPVEVAHWPQYISMYLLGIMAWRGDWLERFDGRVGWVWLAIGAVAGVTGWWWPHTGVTMVIWETLVCAGLCVGLLTLFRERFDTDRGAWPIIAGGAYGVYLVHVAVVVACQLVFELYPMSTLMRFVASSVVGVIVSYAIVFVLDGVPVVRRALWGRPLVQD